MHVRLLEQFTPDGFACAALKQHGVRQHHRRSSVLLQDGEDVLEEIGCLLLVLAQKSSRLMMSDSLDDSPASLTMVTLLFLPNGGLARTISYSPCFPASASFVTTGKSDSDSPPIPCNNKFIAQSRVTLSTNS